MCDNGGKSNTIESESGFLQQENGFFLLQENGYKILI
jgi:hypothetical protein